MRVRAARALAVAVLPALLAGACAGQTSSGSLGLTPGAIAAAAAKTTAAKSARMHMVVKMTTGIEAPGTPEGFTVVADGRTELGRPRGVLTMDMGGLALPGVDTKMEMRLIDTVAYMKMPAAAFDEAMPAGKKWVRLDFGALSAEEGFDFADLQNFGMGDPAKILGFLKNVGSVSKVGSDRVRGEKSTHYKAVVDLAKVLAETDGSGPAVLRQLAGEAGPKTMPVDVWIGTDGLLRRVDLAMDLSGIDEMATGAKIAMQMEMFDFGVSIVDVVAPPANEVIDMGEMMGAEAAA